MGCTSYMKKAILPIKITYKKPVAALPFSAVNLKSVENEKNRKKYGADGNGTVVLPENIKEK
ncbi:hypothetical protein EYV94_10890 [Puteibacter caeruleilacunae]|nr:hypothetical protein EYV94_10890 [Puteibacter caeruleilacunae]